VRWLLPITMSLCLSVACADDEPTELGPAVLTIYLGNDTSLGSLLHLRSGLAMVFATEVDTDGVRPRDGLRRADVVVRADQLDVPAPATAPGTYVTDVARAPDLALGPEQEVTVAVEHQGRSLGLQGPVPEVLRLPFQSLSAPAGSDLVVPLPDRWWRTHPWVVTQLLDAATGQVLWTDRPADLAEWIDILSDPDKPRQVVVPGRAMSAGSRVLAACFVD